MPPERRVVCELIEALGAGDVKVGIRPEVENHRSRERVAGAGEPLDLVADRRRVAVEHRRLEAQYEQVGYPLVVGVAPKVSENASGTPGTRPRIGDVRSARAVDDEEDHGDDADHEARQNIDRDHTDARADAEPRTRAGRSR